MLKTIKSFGSSFLILCLLVNTSAFPMQVFADDPPPEDDSGLILDPLFPPEDAVPPDPEEVPAEDPPPEGDEYTTDSVEVPVTPLPKLNPDDVTTPAKLSGEYSISEFTGEMQYVYPIFTPSGRNNLTPQVSLNYAHSRKNINSNVGYGWELAIPKIERFSRTGIEDLHTLHNFTSPFAGGNGELAEESVDANGYGIYVPKVVSGKYKHEFLANKTWQVTDSAGTIYTFGDVADARIQADSTMIHTWYITKAEDTNGNIITYEYVKSQGNPYLARILYGGETTPYEIRFEPYYSGTIEIFDTLPSYSYGFSMETDKKDLLDSIEVRNDATADKFVYEFTYNDHGFETTSFLYKIQKKGILNSVEISDLPSVFSYASYNGYNSMPVSHPEAVTGESLRFVTDSVIADADRWIFGDFNGDGWTDIIKDIKIEINTNEYEYQEEQYINQGNGTWVQQVSTNPDDSHWAYNDLTDNHDIIYSPMQYDFNGDHNANACYKLVKKRGSTLGGFGCVNAEGNFGAGGGTYEYQFLDVNADGLLDKLNTLKKGRNQGNDLVYLNDGNAFNGGYRMISSGYHNTNEGLPWLDYGTLTGDINGDGLDDFVHWKQVRGYNGAPIVVESKKILLSTLDGWQEVTNDVQIPIPLFYFNCKSDGTCDEGYENQTFGQKATFYDINRDGLVDILSGNGKVYFNNGKGWDSEYVYIPTWTQYAEDVGGADGLAQNYDVRFSDFNKDGILERTSIRFPKYGYTYFYSTDSKAMPILIQIDNPTGGQAVIEYTPASAYQNPDGSSANFDLPVPRLTVSKITTRSPLTLESVSPTSETTYHYSGGKLYRPNVVKGIQKQEMLGFQKVEKTLPDGSKVITEYLQGDVATNFSEKGYMVNQKTYEADGKILSETRNEYTTATRLANKSYETLLQKTLNISYNPQNSSQYQSSAQEFNYDQYGNLTQQIDFGEVNATGSGASFTDIGTDKITTNIEYAENTSKHILSLPSRTESKDQNNEIIGEQKTYYDNLALGQVSTGNATKTETRVTNSPLEYLTTETVYNSYGLPTDVLNARSYPTYITYDSNNLYPQYITNAKDQTTTYAYHPLFGVPEQVTDPNGMVSKTVFDGLGRVTETKVSNPDNSSQLITTSATSYDFSSSPVSITATAYANNTDVNSNPIEITSKTYLDGFGRTIQTKSEAEGSNIYTTSSTIYDERGNVQKELFPQYKSGLSFSNINSNDPGLTYEYDALGRVTSATVPYGSSDTATTTTSYDRWSQTVTNPNGVPKEFFYDSRGNLLQITEHNGANEYDTLYTYNPNNNLTQITDSQGNTKDFSYDLLGRKLYENDFHSDGTFSEWQYAYDENGNLIWMKDSKNQEINFTYDQLDRILTEQSTQTTSTYSYDSAPNGIGRLASVTSPNITKSYEYDILGNIAQETRTISSTDYVTQYEYDLLGNPTQITYPDSENTLVSYGFNNAGQTSTVDTASDSITTNIDYNPIGLPTVIDYANGVTTTNTYDINQNYKLVSKLTTDSSSTELQNISYTFDKVGNITNKDTDDSTQLSGNTSYTYDDLDRLLTATTTNAASGDNYTRTYSYDSIGNITSKLSVDSGQSPEDIDYTYSESNYASPHAVTQAGDQNFTYDNNGNLQTDGTWTHSWDYKDRLISSSTSGTTVSYEYDEAKTRVIKHNESTGKITQYINDFFDIEDGEEKLYFYSGDLKLATLDSSSSAPTGDPDECDVPTSGNWTVNSDCTIATFKTAPADVTITAGTILTIASSGILEVDLNTNSLTVENGGGILIENGGSLAQSGLLPSPSQGGGQGEISLVFHHSDHLSGASVDTSESGSVVALNDYYPFGDTRIESGEYENDYTYTGKERDEDTELLYYEARYYNSNIGRFISIDPWSGDISDPQSLNKYAYVRNNPLKYVDPEGESYIDVNEEAKKYFQQASDIIGRAAELIKIGGYEAVDSVAMGALPNQSLNGQLEKDAAKTGAFIAMAADAKSFVSKGALKSFLRNSQKLWGATKKFGSSVNAYRHFLKHGKEFSDVKTASQYLDKASDFVTNIPDGAETFTRNNGDTLIYDAKNNIFGIKNKDGQVTTFYKPGKGDPEKGKKYWDNTKKKEGERKKRENDSSVNSGK